MVHVYSICLFQFQFFDGEQTELEQMLSVFDEIQQELKIEGKQILKIMAHKLWTMVHRSSKASHLNPQGASMVFI